MCQNIRVSIFTEAAHENSAWRIAWDSLTRTASCMGCVHCAWCVCVCVVYNNFSPPEHRSRDITSIVILHNPIKQKLIAKPTPNLLQYNFEIYLLENCEKHACSIIGKISLDQRKLRLGSKFEWLDLMNWLAFQFWWVDRKCDPAGLGFFFVLVLGRRPLGRWWRWRHGGQLQSN